MSDELNMSWRAGYVVQSYLVAVIGSYTGVQLAEQARLSVVAGDHQSQRKYLVLQAFALGAAAIWSMHFVGQAALILETQDGVEIPIEYEGFLTVLSLAAAVGCVYLGLFIAAKDKYYNSANATGRLVDDLIGKSMAEVRSARTAKLMALVSGLHHLVAGGVVTGAGVCVMHYVGMEAQDMDAVIEYNWGLVILSVIIACTAATAAFWIIFRLLVFKSSWDWLRLASALIMGIAVCSMHYTGMYAGKAVLRVGERDADWTIEGDEAAKAALAIALGLAAVAGQVSVADLRRDLKNAVGKSSNKPSRSRASNLTGAAGSQTFSGARSSTKVAVTSTPPPPQLEVMTLNAPGTP